MNRPAPLFGVLAVTFLGSVSGGAFWSGLFFVTAEHYRFSPVRNLALASLMGAVYALSARYAGALTAGVPDGSPGRRPSPRAVLVGSLAVWGAAALAPTLLPDLEGALWASALVGAATSAITWPVVESYLAAGRHGPSMRAAIGWFNVTWTPATALPLLLLPAVARVGLTWTVSLSALANAAALVVALVSLPRRPGAHEDDAADAAVGSEYPALMRSTAWLLPLSYVVSAALGPVLPHRLAAVGADTSSGGGSVVAALWMAARFAALLVMARTGFWHGRWGTLALAGAALAAGLALVLLASSLAVLVAGLLLFGAGMGITYCASLYCSMAVGRAAVEAGGNFEARIGLGYCVGPLAGIAGQLAMAPADASSATVALTWLVIGAAGWRALVPYVELRRRRR
jgi:hypothetical protein